MYKLEPLVMLVPDIFGGSTELQLPSQQSKAVRVMDQMPPDLIARIGEDGPRYYWVGWVNFSLDRLMQAQLLFSLSSLAFLCWTTVINGGY